MLRHGMTTRLRKKIEQPPEKTENELREPVRLTEDLLYLVNKKLQNMDKEDRNRELEWKQMNNPQHKCFTEVKYRKIGVQLSQSGKG